jgi:hypothetical protein
MGEPYVSPGRPQSGVRRIQALFEEMQNANDRVAAVSSAAWVDDTLAAALSTRFVKMGKTWTDRVFDGAGAPLGTFSAKIVIGYALGLFGPLTRTDLDTIRSIRNDFAHNAGPLLFTQPDIAAKCAKLTTPSRAGFGMGAAFSLESPPGPKALYVRTAQYIAGRLINGARAHHQDENRPSPPLDALP